MLCKNLVGNVLTNPLGRVIGDQIFITSPYAIGNNGSLISYKRINENDSIQVLDLKDYEEIHSAAVSLAKKNPDPFRRDLVLWTEYMVRFKKLFDDYQQKKLTETDVHEFLNWIHSHRDSRVFVHDRVDSYFQALLDALRNGTEWIHFNLDWEDDYIRRHDRILG